MITYPIPRIKAVEMIQLVADQYGIKDAFYTFDEDMIEYKLGQLASILKDNPTDRRGNTRCPAAVWFALVEDELGIDPGDPHEVREYEMYMRNAA